MTPVEAVLRLIAAAAIGYGLGSLPSGVIIGRIFGNIDPRSQGSGKTGATNVLRALGPGPAALVVVLDVGKGVVAVLVARYIIMPAGHGISADMQGWAEAVGGMAALLGHNYSMFIKFTGGRGVATGGGVILAMMPLVLLIALILLVGMIALTRYVSLGSITAAATAAVADWIAVASGHDIIPHAVFMTIGGAFVILAHHDNIQRLLHGTERKFGQKRV